MELLGDFDRIFGSMADARRRREDAALEKVLMISVTANPETVRSAIKEILSLHDIDTWNYSCAATEIIRLWKTKRYGEGRATELLFDLARSYGITVDTETSLREMEAFFGAVSRAAAPALRVTGR